MRRSKLVALAATAAVFAGSAGTAFADTIYIEAASVSAAPGATATFTVGLTAETVNNDPAGCNATPASKVTISFATSNAAVANAPTAVLLEACDNPLTLNVVEGAQTVNVHVKDTAVSSTSTELTASGTGGLFIVNPGGQDKRQLNTDKIVVTAVGKRNQATLSVTGPTGGTFGQTYPITTSGGNGTGTVTYTISGGCEAVGTGSVKVTSGVNNCSIAATKAADATYNSTTSAAATVVVSKAAQAALTVASPSAATFGDAPVAPSVSGGSGAGAVTFAATGDACGIVASGPDAGKLEIKTGADDCSLTASKASDNDYNAAVSAAHKVTISKAAQAPLSMTSASTGTFGDAITLTSTGGSGTGATTYAATGTACSIPTTGADAGKLSITSGTGDCSVTATKAADGNYTAVSSAAQTITVSKKAQDGLAIVAAATGTFGSTLLLGTTGGSGDGAVSYSTGDSSACSVSGAELTITSGTGTCSVTATKAANGNYTAVSAPAHGVSPVKQAATLTLTGLTADYDGTAHAAGATTNPASLNGVSFTYNGQAVAPIKAGRYTVDAVLTHPDYAASVTGTLVIAAKQVTGAFTVADKTYDNSTAASATPAPLAGAVPGDLVSVIVTNATFDTKAAGAGKTVTGTLSLTGADAGNYSLTSTTGQTTATIRTLALTGAFTAGNKVYDGSRTATVASQSLPGVLGLDMVVLDVTGAAFADKNVGANKTVTANLALSGADTGNYSLTSATATTTAEITVKLVAGSITASDKRYDGNDSATVSHSLGAGDVVVGDTGILSANEARFADKNAGLNKTVSANLALSGPDAGNYRLTAYSATTTATITKAPVQASYTANNKVYNGLAAAVVANLDLTGVLTGDQALLTVTDPAFNDKNVGTAKPVSGTLGLSGTDAGNYEITNTPAVTANITPAPLAASFVANDKDYDGTANATGQTSFTGKVGTDDVNVSTAATFADKNVGENKLVTATFTLSGTDKGNYTVNSPTTDTATITAKQLTGTITASSKVYDGGNAATVSKNLTGAVAGDDVTLTVSGAAFDSKTVGTGKTVTATLSLTGIDATNYTVNATATSLADITAKPVSGSFTAADKLYDGSAAATITSSTITGVISGDSVTLNGTGASASFADAAVGTGKTVTSTGFALAGTDAGNYKLTMGTTTASIQPWTFKGFYQPVDMGGVVNTVKAGATVPLKFEVFKGTTELTDMASIKTLSAKIINCSTLATLIDDIELTTTGATVLRYDTTGGQYIYNWQTPKTIGTCYAVTVAAQDGTGATAYFKTK